MSEDRKDIYQRVTDQIGSEYISPLNWLAKV